ncbi:MAG TPA: ACP S-malonyltransferase [Microbacteriaceae bacterium]|nr:ACP S-malonyltransferase [Microbacteriaceae bacterium]
MIVVVCPGQGSQTPGFLNPWLDLPGVAESIDRLSQAAEVDLRTHGTVSDADTIRDTRIAQPLIVAASLISLQALRSASPVVPTAFAGHSVGEFAAAAAAGVLSDEEALQLVGVRGRAMAEAAAQVETGMSAVVGGETDEVVRALEAAGLSPANYNGGGQIVAAGPIAALAALKDAPPAGARVIPLQVAGAFHTAFMASAVETVRAAAAGLSPSDPTATLWTNRDGSVVASGSNYVDLLIGQIALPVRWDLCMADFAAKGVTGVVELAPAGALVGLAKRGLPGIPTVAVKSPDDLHAAVDLLASAEGTA